jgi:hypothetical protein
MGPSMSGSISIMPCAFSARTSSSSHVPSKATKSATSSHDRDSANRWIRLDGAGSCSPRRAVMDARIARLSSRRVRQQSPQNRYVHAVGLEKVMRAIVPFAPHQSEYASDSRGDEPLPAGKDQLLIY